MGGNLQNWPMITLITKNGQKLHESQRFYRKEIRKCGEVENRTIKRRKPTTQVTAFFTLLEIKPAT